MEESRSGISFLFFVVNFLFEAMRKDRRVSTPPPFLNDGGSFQTAVFDLPSTVTEDELKSDCKFVISVCFFVVPFLDVFFTPKMYTAEPPPTTKPNREGQEVNTRWWDASDQNTSRLVFF